MSSSLALWCAVLALFQFGATLADDPPTAIAVRPLNYNLAFNIDANQKYLVGSVSIDFKPAGNVLPKNECIELNSEGLTISSVTLSSGSEDKGAKHKLFPRRNILQVLASVQLFSETTYTLKITFNRTFDSTPYGIYYTKYQSNNGNMIATNMKPNHARRVFPCFDDPSLVATFQLTLVYNQGWKAYSGTGVANSISSNDGLETVKFKKTDKIPTWNVMFFLTQGYVTLTEAGSPFDVLVPSKAKQMVTLNSILWTVLNSNYFSDYLNSSGLVRPKIVMIPDLPEPTVNYYGVIAMRPEVMKLELDLNTLEEFEKCNLYLRCLAGIFYGGSLSPASLKDMWISQSVAMYLQTKAIRQVSYWGEELVDNMDTVRLGDARVALPIAAKQDDKKTDLQFSMAKGAAFLTMLDSVMKLKPNGTNSVEDFLKSYFDEQKYKAGDTEHFLEKLSPLVGMKKEDLEVWVYSEGYPILLVEDVTPDTVTIEVVHSDVVNWAVPTIYTTPSMNSGVKEKLVVITGKMKIEEVTSWILVNPDNTGLYQVEYQVQMLNKLKDIEDDLNWKRRTAVLDAAFVTPLNRMADYNDALILTDYLFNEKDYAPWSVASRGFLKLRNLLYQSSDVFDDFQLRVQTLADGAYGHFGLEMTNATNYYDNVGRQQSVSFACTFEHHVCLQQTYQLFTELPADMTLLYKGNSKVGADVLDTVECVGIKQMNLTVWEAYFNKAYVGVTDQRQREKALRALACPKDSSVIKKFLKMCNNPAKVKKEDKFKAFEAIYSRPENVDITLTFLQGLPNKKKVMNKDWIQLFRGIAPMLSTDDQKNKLSAIHADVGDGPVGDAINDAISTLDANAGFLSRVKASIVDWVNHHTPEPPVTTTSTSSSLSPNGTTAAPGSSSSVKPTDPTPSSSSSANPGSSTSTAKPSSTSAPGSTTKKPKGGGASAISPAVALLLPAVVALLVLHN